MGWVEDNFLTQAITYWGSPQSDGRGGYTYEDPVAISGRWSDKHELYIANDATEKISNAVVLVDRDVDVGGYLALGDYTDSSSSFISDPSNIDGAYRIEAFGKTADLMDEDYVRRVWL